MEARQAFKELREGRIRPCYICYGMESYLVDEFVDRLIEQVTAPEDRDMAIVRFDLAETSLNDVIDEAQTPPFLAPRKVIIAKDSALFSAARETAKVEHQPQLLIDYLAKPLDSTVLVFIVQHEKLDERKKLVKTAKSLDAVVHFAPLSAGDLVKWILRRAEKQGRRMHADAADELIRCAGTNMRSLAAETDKLILHAGEDGEITTEAVRQLVPPTVEQSVFKLTDELAALRTEQALAIYHDLLRQKEEPIRLAALLIRQIRLMLLIKELSGQGIPQQQMAGQLGLRPYAVKLMAQQARNFSIDRLAGLLSELADLDYAMKSGKVDKALGLELFLLRTASAGAG